MFREVLSVTEIHGGVATNVIPARVEATLNFRYAPDRAPEDAAARVAELVGRDVEILANSPPGACPVAGHPAPRPRSAPPAASQSSRSRPGRTSPTSRREGSMRSTSAPAPRVTPIPRTSRSRSPSWSGRSRRSNGSCPPSGYPDGVISRITGVSLRSRGLLLLPVGAFVVHQLRYRIAYGDQASAQLAAQGHSYLDSFAPWLVLLLCLAAGSFLVRVAQALATGRSAERGRSFATVWIAASCLLTAIYAVQELLEGLVAAGHPAGLAGIVGHGGWWAAVVAVGVGFVIAALLRRCRRGRRGRRTRRGRSPSRSTGSPTCLLQSPPSPWSVRGRSQRPARAVRLPSPLDRRFAAPLGVAGRSGRRRSALLWLVVMAALALLLPANAAAHGRGPTVAIDDRLVLTRPVAGLSVNVLDGDRSLHVVVAPGQTAIVRGYLGEPMIRFADGTVEANRASPTATADRIVAAGTGWQRVAERSLLRVARPPARAPSGRGHRGGRPLVGSGDGRRSPGGDHGDVRPCSATRRRRLAGGCGRRRRCDRCSRRTAARGHAAALVLALSVDRGGRRAARDRRIRDPRRAHRRRAVAPARRRSRRRERQRRPCSRVRRGPGEPRPQG